jgi:chromosome partitioning protein
MGEIYAVVNQKGGVSKTTTAFNTGYGLYEMGKKVLLVELDQQGNLALYSGLKPGELDMTIYDILKSYAFADRKNPATSINKVIYKIRDGLFIAPANNNLSSLDIEIVAAPQRENVLQRALAPIKSQYDYIFLDCPPNLGLLVLNALVAANKLLVPLQTDYLAAQGLGQLMDTVEFVQDRLNPGLSYAGILLTMADERTGHTRDIIKKARADFKDKIHVFSDVVRMSVRVKESPIAALSVMEYDPNGQAAKAYRTVAKELLSNA